MKKFARLFPIAFLAIIAVSAFAQSDAHQQHMLNEILKEKTAILKQTKAEAPDLKHTAQNTGELSLSNNGIAGEAETFIAINPNDKNNLVASYMSGENTLSFPIYYTKDGGTSWSKSSFDVRAQLLADFPGQMIGGGGDPVFAFDANGKCYFSWIYLSVENNAFDTAYMNMFWAHSIDGGVTWSVESNHKIGGGAILLSGGGAGGIAEVGDGIFDRQWMDVDRSNGPNHGTVYASTYFIPHATSTFPNEGMVLNRMTPTSGGFQQTSYVGTGTTQFGNVKVNQQNGTIHVTYCDVMGDRIFHAKSTDGGSTFSTPVMVASTYNLMPNISNRVHSRENAATNLAIDGAGNLHLVWSGFVPGNFSSYYTQSTNGGNSWSIPLLIDNLLDTGKAFMPTVAASGNNVSISTYSIVDGKRSVYKTVSSLDNGQNFMISRTISGDTTNYQNFGQQAFFGDYDCSVMDGCDLYSIWSDGRGNAPVVYVGKTDACSPVSILEYSPLGEELTVGELFPSPAIDFVEIPFTTTLSGKISMEVISLDGKTIIKNHQNFSSATTFLKQNVSTLSNGTYLMILTTDKGLRFSRKFVVSQ